MSHSPKFYVEGMKKLHISHGDCDIEEKTEQWIAKSCRDVHHPVDRIREGFLHFKINKFDRYPEYYQQLAENQSPKFLVISCSDSRVSASHILNFQPGEAFMIRNIANIVPPFNQLTHTEAGSVIEYAMIALKVENILVIGHSRCGGIHRLMEHPEDGTKPYDFIDEWMKIVSAAKTKVVSEFGHLPFEEQTEICEKEAVHISLVNLLTYPYIRTAVANKAVKLKGAHYNFVNGSFELWDFNTHITPPVVFK